MSYIGFNGKLSKYLIVDGSGAKATAKRQLATEWKTFEAANNVLRSLKKAKKHKIYNIDNYYVLSTDDEVVPVSTEKLDLATNIISKEFPEPIEKGLINIFDFLDGLEKRKNEFVNQLSIVDMELNDVLHKIELTPKLNACEGYKLYKMIYDMRVRRRKIKDEITIIECIMDVDFKTSNIDKIKNQIEGLKNRKYMPRIHKELFE